MAEQTRSPERLFDEAEVKRIFERASVLEHSSREKAQGLTVAELEAIAREAGIDPARVQQAIRELEAGPAGEEKPGFFGGPFTRTVERTFEGELSQEAREELVRQLKRLYGPGQLSTIGEMITFSVMGPVMLEVSVISRNGRTQVHYGVRYGQMAGGLYGGFVGGLGAGVGANLGWMLPVFGHYPWYAGVAAAAGVVGGAFGLARTLLTASKRRHDGRFDELLHFIAREVRKQPG